MQASALRGAVEGQRQQQHQKWPRGPVLQVAEEAARSVKAALLSTRREVGRPSRVEVRQLRGQCPVDWTVIKGLPTDRPLRVLELVAGVGTATQALVRLGYTVGRVFACEKRNAARMVHQWSGDKLAGAFPGRVEKEALGQLHNALPQDVQLVSEAHLEALGPIDLVVAGWPCQGSSAAGRGMGLDDARSGLVGELLRLLTTMQRLHRRWGQQLAYVVEHVAAGFDRRPKVREHFAAVRGLLGPEVVIDAAQLGSRAHRLRAWWTNLAEAGVLRAAVEKQTRPPGLFVHQVLDSGR